jgi:hypothetical protein
MQKNINAEAVEEGISLCKKFIIYFLETNNFSRENLEDVITCTNQYLLLAKSFQFDQQENANSFLLFQTVLKNQIQEKWPLVENYYIFYNKKSRISPGIKQKLWKVRYELEQILE